MSALVCTQVIFQVYFVHLSRQGYAPTTIRSLISLIKKMCLVRFQKVYDDVWDELHSCLNNVLKDYVPAEANDFPCEELDKLCESLGDHDVELQTRVTIMVAFCGGIRRGEHHALPFEYMTIYNDDWKKVFVRLKVTKGNKAGRKLAMTDDDIV